MARLVCACALGVVIGTAVGAALGIRAQEVDDTDEVLAAATEAGVQPEDLTAALASLDAAGISATPRGYLESVGEIPSSIPPAPTRPHPPAGAAGAGGGPSTASGFGPNVDARAWCVETIESNHGRFMYNATPVGHEHAQGWMGWLPSTAASVGVRIGDRASEWAGFRRMLAAGRGREWAGIAAGIC